MRQIKIENVKRNASITREILNGATIKEVNKKYNLSWCSGIFSQTIASALKQSELIVTSLYPNLKSARNNKDFLIKTVNNWEEGEIKKNKEISGLSVPYKPTEETVLARIHYVTSRDGFQAKKLVFDGDEIAILQDLLFGKIHRQTETYLEQIKREALRQ